MDERVRRMLDIELQAENEARYWRGRGEEPSQHIKDVLARCAEFRAAGVLPPKGTPFATRAPVGCAPPKVRFTAHGPDGRTIEVTAEERAILLRAGARDESGDA